jgi:hypothetical protein
MGETVNFWRKFLNKYIKKIKYIAKITILEILSQKIR